MQSPKFNDAKYVLQFFCNLEDLGHAVFTVIST